MCHRPPALGRATNDGSRLADKYHKGCAPTSKRNWELSLVIALTQSLQRGEHVIHSNTGQFSSGRFINSLIRDIETIRYAWKLLHETTLDTVLEGSFKK